MSGVTAIGIAWIGYGAATLQLTHRRALGFGFLAGGIILFIVGASHGH